MLDDIVAEIIGKFVGDSTKNKFMARWLTLIIVSALLLIIVVIFLLNN